MILVDKLLTYFLETDYEDLPNEVITRAKCNIIDIIGDAIAGSNSPDCMRLRGWIKRNDNKKRESTVLVYREKFSVAETALLNAAMARVCDLDDVHEKAVSHIGVSLIPLALAVGEKRNINGKLLLSTVALGYDLTARLCLGADLPPGVTGMNTACHAALFGGIAMVCKLRGYDLETTKNALGIGYSMVSGTDQGLLEGSFVVSLQQGLTAYFSILAADFANIGIIGPKDILTGKFGYYNVYQRGKYNEKNIINELGKRYESINVSIKQYPCCRFAHSAIEGVLGIIKENDILPEDVDRVIIYLTRQAFTYVCYPLKSKYTPKNIIEAKFSLPYLIGSVLSKKKLTIEEFTIEAIYNKETLLNAKKVVPVIDEGLDYKYKDEIGPSRIELITKNGKVYKNLIELIKGSPGNPLSIDECFEKFTVNYNSVYSIINKEKIEKLKNVMNNLQNLQNINDLIQLINTEDNS